MLDATLDPRLTGYQRMLETCVRLTYDIVEAYLKSNGHCIQAISVGRDLVVCSRVRSLVLTGEGEQVTASAHVECEYLNMKKAYITKISLNSRAILTSSCTCVANNQQKGHCKHESALLWVLLVIQSLSLFSENPPKYLRRSQATKRWMKDERPGRKKQWHYWPWRLNS